MEEYGLKYNVQKVFNLFAKPYVNYRDGEGLRLVIPFLECDQKCDGCHLTKDNPVDFDYVLNLIDNIKKDKYLQPIPLQFSEQLQQITLERQTNHKKFNYINNNITKNENGYPVIGITLSGGNPLSKNNIKYTKKILENKNINDQIIYLGYDINYIKSNYKDFFEKYKNKIKYIKAGNYDSNNKNYGLYYGSKNQNLYDQNFNNIEKELKYNIFLKINEETKDKYKKYENNNQDMLIYLNSFQENELKNNFQLNNELQNSIIIEKNEKYILGINNIFGFWIISNSLDLPFVSIEIQGLNKKQLYGLYTQIIKHNDNFQIQILNEKIFKKETNQNNIKIQLDTVFDKNLNFKRNYNDISLLKKMYRKFFIEEYNQYYYLQNNETYKLYLETYMG